MTQYPLYSEAFKLCVVVTVGAAMPMTVPALPPLWSKYFLLSMLRLNVVVIMQIPGAFETSTHSFSVIRFGCDGDRSFVTAFTLGGVVCWF